MFGRVVATVYVLNFLGSGSGLVPFDSMELCEAAKTKIGFGVTGLKPGTKGAREFSHLLESAGEKLICVKTK